MTDIETPAIDVNQAFDTERREQLGRDLTSAEAVLAAVAAGKLRNLGGGRFKVTDPGSWDDGEILHRNVDVLGEGLTAQHGLDMTSGSAALYSAVPVWHDQGTVIPGGLTDLGEVLTIAGINYEVHKVPARYRNPITGAEQVKEDVFHTCRFDNGEALGTVGRVYDVLQNREAFQLLLELVAKHEVKWESAGALRDGAKTFASLLLPQEIRIDAEGVNDEIKPFLVAINNHTGKGLFEIVVTPWRPICGNTERFAVRDAITRWGVRHTSTMRDRMEEARIALKLSMEYFDRFKEEEERLAQSTIAIDEFHDLLDELFGELDENAKPRARTNHEIRQTTLTELWEKNTGQLGRTGYAAERALTEYADWATRLRPTGRMKGNMAAARATAVLEGSADAFKTRAHRALLLRTNR